ncbi:hypothetical protein [Yoonia litorea]|uniref:Asparagine synthase n=1 Tax=Yoonia litorea TaxID=1123755 RepID=A0A1I6MI97_9RHOB|nr:hypothetical protein [Yoonia litorea]SFS15372.1 hypothetical protein SAMN05444714_1846 [Yoonia litorea]
MNFSITYTCKDVLPARRLSGLAYVGPDIVVGDEGYKNFAAERQQTIRPGSDGAYVVINEQPDCFEIGTDFGGYSQIYVYQDGPLWAFSNSFYDLAQRVSGLEFPMTLYAPGAASMHISAALGQQPLSDRTPIAQIKLLSRSEVLRVSKDQQPQLTRAPAPDDLEGFAQVGVEYADALERYVSTWVGRYITILNSDVHLTCDVTGGLDSRTNLAMLIAAAQIADFDLNETVHINSNAGLKKDREISEQIGTLFDFEIGRQKTKSYRRPTVEGSYAKWKSYYLHSYWPAYLPTVARSSKHFWTGGAGGEAHRWITGIGLASSFEKLLERKRGDCPDPQQFEQLMADAKQTVTDLSKMRGQPEHSLVCHYRNFRERFHHGRRSNILYALSPLAGAGLSAVSQHAPVRVLKTQKIFADIIANTAPELLGVPFEKDYPNFAGRDAHSLLDFGGLAKRVSVSGKVFGGDAVEDLGDFRQVDALKLMRSDFEGSVVGARDTGLVTASQIINARTLLETEERPSAAALKPVATTILAGHIANWI